MSFMERIMFGAVVLIFMTPILVAGHVLSFVGNLAIDFFYVVLEKSDRYVETRMIRTTKKEESQ